MSADAPDAPAFFAPFAQLMAGRGGEVRPDRYELEINRTEGDENSPNVQISLRYEREYYRDAPQDAWVYTVFLDFDPDQMPAGDGVAQARVLADRLRFAANWIEGARRGLRDSQDLTDGAIEAIRERLGEIGRTVPFIDDAVAVALHEAGLAGERRGRLAAVAQGITDAAEGGRLNVISLAGLSPDERIAFLESGTVTEAMKAAGGLALEKAMFEDQVPLIFDAAEACFRAMLEVQRADACSPSTSRIQPNAAPLWRPMDTAPMNGKPLILFARAKGATAAIRVIGWWAEGQWIALQFTTPFTILEPLLWTPLPDWPEPPYV